MPNVAAACMPRPHVALRVGVTGAAALNPALLDRFRDQVADVLAKIKDEAGRNADTSEARRVYAPAIPALRIVSPLGEGADRLVAGEAIALGYALDVPLPFAQRDYESTFGLPSSRPDPTSVREFRTLLDAAGPRVLTLDGAAANDIHRHRSYEAVGRLVVRNCDLLIAIWDNAKPARGRGGTTDTVHYALHTGIPVWWIHATAAQEPRWLNGILDLYQATTPAMDTPLSEQQLRAYVARLIHPPPGQADDGSWFDRLLTWLRQRTGLETDPLLALLAERGKPNIKFWNAHLAAIGSLRRQGRRRQLLNAAKREGSPHRPSAEPTAAQTDRVTTVLAGRSWSGGVRWYDRIARLLREPFRRNEPQASSSTPARLSRIYQDRYRTSYLTVFVCGALALIGAAIGLAFPIPETVEIVATCVEFLALATIGGVVFVNRLFRWHERYISYRMLGELLRLATHLQALAWTVPGSRVAYLASGTRRDWVAWLFAALVRSMPLPTARFDRDTLEAAGREIRAGLIAGQLRYHERRRDECRGAAAILEDWGRTLFLLTLVLVVLKMALVAGAFGNVGHGPVLWVGLLGVLLPSASAAFFGVKAYEELEGLAEQSDQMLDDLHRADNNVERIELALSQRELDHPLPLASQLLGAELFEVATVMLSDVTGWAQLFRLKTVEA